MQPVVRNNGLFHPGSLRSDSWAPRGVPRPRPLFVITVVLGGGEGELERQAVNDQLAA